MTEPAAAGAGAAVLLEETKALFLEAILDGDRASAVRVALRALEAGADIGDVYVDVLQESLYEVGRLWEANKISVAREHLATSISQFVVGQLYERLPRSTAVRGRLLLTGIEGEMHQVGGNMVADILEADGWTVRFLGSNVPGPDILDAVEDHKPDVLGISCTMLQNIPHVASLVGSVRERYGDRAPLVVLGGCAFRESPDSVAELGADGWAPDLRAAVILLRGLQPRGGRKEAV